MRAGVIDIGSSSIKLIIGEGEGEEIKILEHLKNTVPIGNYTFYRGSITPETIHQILSILEKYQQALKEYDVANVMLIATTAVREARNRDIFIDTISRKTGLNAEILTAGDVVYYIDSYLHHKLKNTYPIHEKTVLIAELGSGSLDVSLMDKGFTQLNLGLPIGTLRIRQLMSKLEGSSSETCEAVQEFITHELAYLKDNISPRTQIDDIILIDEKYSAYLAAILADKNKEAGFWRINREDIAKILESLGDKNTDEIVRTYKIPSEIAETITAYALLLNSLFSVAEIKYIYILEASLAEAILANVILGIELAKKYNKTNQLVSVATFLCRKFNADLNHVKHVAELSKTLFENFKEMLGLKPEDLLYLTLAAYLHDIGSFIHNRSHHKHSEYIINSLNLFRLTEEEINVIACIARYHRKAPPAATHLLYNSLNLDKQILVQKLSAILRIANSLDSSHKQKLKKLEIKFSKGNIAIYGYSNNNCLLEKLDFSSKKDFFEEITGNKISFIPKPA